MVGFNTLRQMHINDEVAVLRRRNHTTEVVDIAKVKYVGEVIIQTNDNRYYSRSDGYRLATPSNSYIEPVTNMHRMALHGAVIDRAFIEHRLTAVQGAVVS